MNDFILFFIVSTFSMSAAGVYSTLGSWSSANLFSIIICLFGLLATLFLSFKEKKQQKFETIQLSELEEKVGLMSEEKVS